MNDNAPISFDKNCFLMDTCQPTNSQSSHFWDKVSERYSEEADLSEYELGQEIFELFQDLDVGSGDSLLEVGCGSGHLSGYLAKKGFNTSLMDFSKVALEKAQAHYKANGLRGNFILGDMLDFSEKSDRVYDVVWNSGVLEHYDSWQVINSLERMASVSRKYVVVLVPNAKSIPYLLFRRHAMDNNEWIWGRELLRDTLIPLAEAAGLKVVEERYLGENISRKHIHYVNLEKGYKNVLEQSLEIEDQKYLIALIAKIQNEKIQNNYADLSEKILKTDAIVNEKTYFFDLFSFSNNVQKLQNKILILEPEIKEKLEEIEKFQNINLDLESKLNEKNSENIYLNNNIFEIKTELNEKNNEIDLLLDEMEKLKTELRKSTFVNSDLRNDILKLNDEVKEKFHEIGILNDEISELKSKAIDDFQCINELKKDLSELKSKINTKNDDVIKLENCIATNERYTHSLKTEIDRIHSLNSWKIVTFIGDRYMKVKALPTNIKKLLSSFFGKILPLCLKRELVRKIENDNSLANPKINYEIFNTGCSEFTQIPMSKNRTIHILTPTFFNFYGNDMYYGGAERYLIELVRLLRKFGCEVNVYQNAVSDWIRFYRDIKVIGLNTGGNSLLLNKTFHTKVLPGELTIYLAFYLATPYYHENSIGISHGVYWDNESMQRNAIINKNDNDIKTALCAIRNCKKMVSVDTNTINWVRAVDYVESEKFTYVSNFVDLEQFYPKKSFENVEKIVIMYPRRLCVARGFWLVEKLVPEILNKYPQTEFHFVGKGDKNEINRVSELVKEYQNRVMWYNLPPEKMHDAYHNADITLVPTVHSEGTSLSCLEAMACGNAVVATNVGGLPNLILDGYNGYLIEPNINDLKEKIELLIKNQNLREQIQKNATNVAKNFTKENWISKWEKILSNNLNSGNPVPSISNNEYLTIVHISTSFIKWSFMQQRPHQLCKEFVNKKIYTFFVVEDDENEKKYSSNYLQIVTRKDELYLEKPILYIYYPHNYEQIKDFNNPLVIYDILDDISIHKQSDVDNKLPENKTAVYYHNKLISEADIVITTATKIFNKYKHIRNDIILVPNAVNYKDFCKNEYDIPADFPSNNNKVIGYYGAIANWVDYELIEYAAKARPDYDFVFIGPISDKRWNKVSRHKNIIYLGTKKYEELADYLHYFDVAIIPFAINDITKATSPVKLFEYMAGKKPIVTTNLDECNKYESVLVSKTYEGFVKNLDKAVSLKENTQYLSLLEKEAKENTWDKRADVVINAIKQKLQK